MYRTRHGLLVPNDLSGTGFRTEPEHDWREDPLHIAPEGWHLNHIRRGSHDKRVWTFRPIRGSDHQLFRAVQEPQGSQMVADATGITGTTEALMWPAVLTGIPANSLRAGQQIFITAGGVTTTPASAATTMTVNPRYGTTTGGTSLGISNTSGTALASQTNVPWDLQFTATVRSIGQAASSMGLVGTGWFRSTSVGTAALAGTLEFGGTILTTADSTTAQGLVFGAILGGSASWTLTTRVVVFEIAN